MNTFSQKLYTFSCRFIQICSLLLAFLLFAGAFLCTCYSEDMESQLVLTKWDNPLWGVLGMAVFLLILAGMVHLLFKYTNSPVKILRILTLLWCICLGGMLILFSKTVPAADAMSVYSIAGALAEGNTSVIHPTDSYLSYYPHQIGLTAFFEPLIRFWNLLQLPFPAYHFIKCVYVGLLCVIICFQERTVHLLWENEKTDCIYLIMAGFNLPFIMYSSFLYGEIPSFAASSAGLYYLLKLLVSYKTSGNPETDFDGGKESSPGKRLKTKRVYYAVLTVAGLSLGTMIRKNNLILMLAALIVLLLEWFRGRRHALLAVGLSCACCCLCILPLVQKSYELRAGKELGSGIPSISYAAMGMQESTRANGWHNGFDFVTFQNAGLDPGLANEVSRQAISERLRFFREHPDYAADFYLQKHLSQWADGTYASRQATLATFGGRNRFFHSLYEGSLSRLFISYCNVYQNILYLGAVACFYTLWRNRRKEDLSSALYVYLGFIAVLGGFLFHTFWEANARYIFPYSLLLLPYACGGILSIIHPAAKKCQKVIQSTHKMT